MEKARQVIREKVIKPLYFSVISYHCKYSQTPGFCTIPTKTLRFCMAFPAGDSFFRQTMVLSAPPATEVSDAPETSSCPGRRRDGYVP
jgi:hypothetical protein